MVINSGRFFPYLGGKTKILDQLIPFFIPSHKLYVEVFGGSAEFLFTKPKELSKFEVYNDINNDLYNLFMVVRDHYPKFEVRLDWLINSRILYDNWNREFKEGTAPNEPIERAVRFYYIQCASFGGKFGGGWKGVGLSPVMVNIQDRLEALRWIQNRLKKVAIDHKDFKEILVERDSLETFFYLDPPYFKTTEYHGVNSFTEKDHRDLFELLTQIRGKWLLTIGDHPIIRELYKRYNFIEIKSKIDVQTTPDEERGEFNNLVYMNYPFLKIKELDNWI